MHEDTSPSIPLDRRAVDVLRAIEAAGHSAWFVGGCVRDALLGRPAHDFDIATSARWRETAAVAEACGFHVVETGTRHGSIAVMARGLCVECTSYRVESGYGDARRPDSVTFVDDIELDLARRDFRMNAVAFHPDRGLLDPFDGRSDIRNRTIRAVGCASERFREDPLRIMRALRFSSCLGFRIDGPTDEAVRLCAAGIALVAKERVFSETAALLCGAGAHAVVAEFPLVLEQAVPGTARLADPRDAHALRRTADALRCVRADPSVRFAALFCGVAQTCGEDGASFARARLRGLKAPRALVERTAALAALCSRPIPEGRARVGAFAAVCGGDVELARDAFALQRAFASTPAAEKAAELAEADLDELVRSDTPLRTRDLAIAGKDLVAAGMAPGPALGAMLEALLDDAIAGRVRNERGALIARAASGRAPSSDRFSKKSSHAVDGAPKAR